jgi:hypothetical protein
LIVIASQRVRANARPDDRLREAIHLATWTEWIASSLSLLAMTAKSVIEPKIISL